MVMPIPTWLEFVIFGVMGLGLLVFLTFLSFLLPWAWKTFFNYLGRNEIRDQEDAPDAPTCLTPRRDR